MMPECRLGSTKRRSGVGLSDLLAATAAGANRGTRRIALEPAALDEAEKRSEQPDESPNWPKAGSFTTTDPSAGTDKWAVWNTAGGESHHGAGQESSEGEEWQKPNAGSRAPPRSNRTNDSS